MKAESMSSREQILKTVSELFFREGYRAIGIDTIVQKSGVAKMTLYRHFASKDDLIVAYLERANEQFWGWFESSTADAAGDARAQLLALYAALEKLVSTPTCFGCPFLNAAAEFPEREHPGHRVALAHKQQVRQRLHALASEAEADNADALADQLLLLMDGAFVSVRMFGVDNPGRHVAAGAAALIDAHCR